MAAISGDQKQKLYILAGFLGALVLVGYFVMSTRSAPDEAVAAPPVTTTRIIAAPPIRPAARPTTEQVIKIVKTTPKAVKVVVAKAPVILVARVEPSRPDPFEPFYYATPEPVATPTPLPPPVELPLPPASVPLPTVTLASAPPNTVLIGLPRPRVASYVLPGPTYLRGSISSNKGAEGGIQIRSANKRLSGVIIGDSVRALLEITTGDAAGQGGGEGGGGGADAGAAATIVRVVQPGDEVDGIKILRIERVYEGGRQITRMFVREGNEERYVDLRPSPTPPTAVGSGLGSEGSSSSSMGSSPGGSPFGAIRPAPGGFPRGGRTPLQ